MNKTKLLLSALAVLVSVVTFPVHAQKTAASLGGTVHDSRQAVVAGASVTVTNLGTAAEFKAQTNDAGLFEFPSLVPGTYSVTIDAKGFKRLIRNGIVLDVEQNASLDLTLEVGSVTQSVQVSGAEPLLETQSSEVGQVVNNQSIVNLPLNQRNIYSLILLVPGVSGSIGQDFGGQQFNVNGGRAGATMVLIDGIPSSPPTDTFNSFTIFPSVDATQEFKVMTSDYSAQFGMSGNGIINVVYKSGTNQLHGSLYEFLRNSDMDANTFINDESGVLLPHSERSQFGGSLGGPVFIPRLFNGRNKLFFFTDYEGLRQGQAASLQAHVPTPAERAGDFSADYTSTGAQINIYDPATTATNSPYTRSQINCNGAVNVICSNRFDPVGSAAMAYFPAQNRPGSYYNYVASGSTPYNIDEWDVKIDGTLSERQQIAFRYSDRHETSGTAPLFPSSVAIAQQSSATLEPAIAGELSYTFARSARNLYELRYGVDHLYYRVTTIADGFDPTQLGFAPYLKQASLEYAADSLTFPGFEMPSGDLSLGDGGQLAKGQLGLLSQAWMADNIRVFSRHTITYGAEVIALANNTNQVGRSTGDFKFSAAVTQGPNAQTASATAGDAYASLLLGLGSGGTVTHNFKIIDTVSQYFAAYLQDDWRTTNKLTLNLGVRYELFKPRTERQNRMPWFDPTIASPITGIPGLMGGLEYPGVNGNPRTQSDQANLNFSPRIGFAYHAIPNLVVQGGYGLFFQMNASEAAATVDQSGYRADSTYYGTQSNTGIFPDNVVSNPFPGASFLPVTGNTLGLYTNTGTSTSNPERRSPTPYIEDYNFGLEYQFPKNWMVDVHYVGSAARQLLYNPVISQLPDSDLSMGSALLKTVPNPIYTQVESSGPESSSTIQQNYLLSPFPQFTGVTAVNYNGAESHYDSVQVKVERRFSSNFSLLAAFTGAKQMDDGAVNNSNVTPSSQQGPTYQDARIPLKQDQYGVSQADVSRRLVASAIYALPFGHGQMFGSNWNRLTDAILGGYQMNGILTLSTGSPLSFSASNVANLLNPGERPNWNGLNAKTSGRVEKRLGIAGTNKYFVTSDFSQPATYTYGNMSATSGYLRGPGYHNLDLSVFKTLDLHENLKLEIRGEAYNISNTPQFGMPTTSVTSASFGDITTQINSPRQIQIAAKILF